MINLVFGIQLLHVLIKMIGLILEVTDLVIKVADMFVQVIDPLPGFYQCAETETKPLKTVADSSAPFFGRIALQQKNEKGNCAKAEDFFHLY